jgi:major inositol transporter-like SP family MFS transporter
VLSVALIMADVETEQFSPHRPMPEPDLRPDAPATFTRSGWFVAAACCASGFVLGYDITSISVALPHMKDTWKQISEKEHDPDANGWLTAFVVSAPQLVAGIIGAPLGGWLSDRYGRRRTLLQINILAGCGVLLQSLAPNIAVLISGRLVLGVSIGATSPVAPAYIGEAVVVGRRGWAIGLFLTFVFAGELLATAIGIPLNQIEGSHLGLKWRLQLGFGLVAVLISIPSVMLAPESPRWLSSQCREEEAEAAAKQLCADPQDLKHLLTEIRQEVQETRAAGPVHFTDFLEPQLRRQLLLCVGLRVANSLTGVIVLLTYMVTTLEYQGFSNRAATAWSVAPSLFSVLGVLAGALVIDGRASGRRPVFFVSCALSSVAAACMCVFASSSGGRVAMLILISIFTFVYDAGFGAASLAVCNELFPGHLRSRGVAIAETCFFVTNFGVGLLYLPVIRAHGTSVMFGAFSVTCAVTFCVFYYVLPETKGLTSDEIQELFRTPLERHSRVASKDDFDTLVFGPDAPGLTASDEFPTRQHVQMYNSKDGFMDRESHKYGSLDQGCGI